MNKRKCGIENVPVRLFERRGKEGVQVTCTGKLFFTESSCHFPGNKEEPFFPEMETKGQILSNIYYISSFTSSGKIPKSLHQCFQRNLGKLVITCLDLGTSYEIVTHCRTFGI